MTDYAKTVRNATPEKLRVMVAEWLGWALEWRYIYRWDQFEYITSDKPDGNHTDRELCFWPEDTGQDRWFIVPDWPGDIGQAMELLAELEENQIADGAFLWSGGCDIYHDREIIAHAKGETAEAICRAWLLAMGEGER